MDAPLPSSLNDPQQNEEVILDPFSGERLFMPARAEKIEARLEEKKTRGKPEGIWSIDELAEAMGLKKTSTSQTVRDLYEQYLSGQSHADYFGLRIPSEAIIRYTTQQGILAYGIQREWGERIAAAYKAEKGEERGKPEGVWSAEELAEAMGLAKDSAKPLIKKFREQFADDQEVNYLGLQIPSTAIVKYTVQTGVIGYGIQQAWGKQIAAAYKAAYGEGKGKPADVWSKEELAEAMGVSRNSAFNLIRDLRDQFATGQVAVDYLGLEIPAAAVVGYRPEGAPIGYGIKHEWGEKVATAYKTLRGDAKEKPDGYWSSQEFGEAIQVVNPKITDAGATGRSVIGLLREELETKENGSYRGVIVPKTAIAIYDYNGRPAYAIRHAEGQKIVDAYAIRKNKPPGFLSAQEFGLIIRQRHPEINDYEAIARRIIDILRSQLETNDEAIYKGIIVKKEIFAEYEYNSKLACAIRQQEAEKLAEVYVPEKGAPAGYLSTEQLGEAIKKAQPAIEDAKAAGSRVITIIRQQHEEKEIADFKGVSVSKVAIATYQNKGRPAYAIREEEAQRIVAVYAAEEKGVPAGVWDAKKLAEEMGLNITTVRGIIRSIRTQLAAGNAEFQGLQIPPEAIKEYQSITGITAYGVAQEWGQKIAAAYKAEKGGEWGVPAGVWSTSKFEASMGLSKGVGKQVIKKLRDQFDAGNTCADFMGLQISSEAVVKYTTDSGTPGYGIEQSWGEKMVALYKAEKGEERGKPEGVWSIEELGKAMGLTKERAFQIVRKFRKQFDEGQSHVDYLGVKIPSEAIVQYTPRMGDTGYGIEKNHGERIAAAYKAEKGEGRGKPDGVWSPEEFADALGVTKSRAQNIIRELRDKFAAGIASAEYLGLQVPSAIIVKYNTQTGQTAYGIQQTWGEKLIAARNAGTEHDSTASGQENTRARLKAKRPTPRTSPAHMTDEEREEAKRGPAGLGSGQQ